MQNGNTIQGGDTVVVKSGTAQNAQVPFADFVADEQCPSAQTKFYPTVTPAGTYSYFWTFPIGGGSTLVNPSRNFPVQGNYPVTLRVRSSDGCGVNSITRLIKIFPNPSAVIVSDFTVPVQICTKDSVLFSDGSSPSNAAGSAREIKQLYGTEKNGFYYIQIPGRKPIYTYCIMDSACHGGGWMLALQGARNSTRFVYRSSFWTAENVLNSIETANDIPDPNPALRGFVNPSTGDPILENIIDAKYHIYNYYKGSDCMALFPGSHTNGNRTRISGKPQYGWNWVTGGAFGRYGNTTLLDFFKNNRRCYQYASIRNNFTRQQSDRSDEGEKITMDYMRQTLDREMPLGIWARQTTYFSYGLNITLSRSAWWASQINGPSLHPHNHQVRWGAVFNENDGDDFSPDVSGGIGLDISQDTRNIFANTYHPHSSAGNRTSCCAVGGSPGSYGMSFQWYIR
jgi:hypothetical protein